MKNVTWIFGSLVLLLLVSGCGANNGGFQAQNAVQPAIMTCTVLPLADNSGATITCPDGTTQTITDGINGLNGATGPTGAQGPQGDTGQTGAAGSNGTQVTMVQLCTMYTGSYPSKFPEFAFNVAGTLFATYWDGTNAWTAPLYPGTYRSTSTGAPCDFVVNSDGTVTDL